MLGAEAVETNSHYHHDKLKHFFASVEEKGTRVMLSFLTNTCTEAIEKVYHSKDIHCHCLIDF